MQKHGMCLGLVNQGRAETNGFLACGRKAAWYRRHLPFRPLHGTMPCHGDQLTWKRVTSHSSEGRYSMLK